MEVWKDIPEFPGYQASSLGRVRSLPRKVMRSNGSPFTVRGEVLKQSLDGHGYPRVSVCIKGRKPAWPGVHRCVMLAFVGPKPEGKEIRHLDGDRTNPHLYNLTYGTNTENSNDRIGHGTLKVSVLGVRIIRKLKGRVRQREVATIFDISQPLVSAIQRGVCHGHI